MIRVRCRDCNKELTGGGNHVQSCGCPNMMTIDGDQISAVDLGRVYMLNSGNKKEVKGVFSCEYLPYQEARRKRKVRKLDFEIR